MNRHRKITAMDKFTDQLLESYISVQHWDMLLTKLEASTFYCPQPLVLDVLFTLATLSPYNSDAIIRKDFGLLTSDRPVNQRALWILNAIVASVKQNTETDDPFSLYVDPEIIEHAEQQLIASMEFLRGNGPRGLRTKAFKKASYSSDLDDPLQKVVRTPHKKRTPDSLSDDSPQKRALKMTLERNSVEANQIDSDSDDDMKWAKTPADTKTLAILRHERIDVTLVDGRIWSAISWALVSASMTQDAIRQQVWQTWNPILDIFIEIFQIELNRYKKNVQQDKRNKFELSSLLSTRFFEQVGRHLWSTRFAEAILPSSNQRTQHNITSVYTNELHLCRSQFLEPLNRSQFRPLLLSLDSVPLRHKLVYLAIQWIELGGSTEFDRSSMDSLVSKLALRILNDGNIDDMILWYRLDPWESSSQMVSFMVEMLTYSLVQLTSFEFSQPESDWYLDKDPEIIVLMFQNMPLQKKYYPIETDAGWEKIQDDFSKINFLAYSLFCIWVKFAKPQLNKSGLLQLAHEGEEERIEVLHSCKRELEIENLIQLTNLLDPLLRQV